jgi:hypothetical protein
MSGTFLRVLRQTGRLRLLAHTVDVFTMSVDQAVRNDQDVRVRIYRGDDSNGLGTMVFDDSLIFTGEPRLAVYQPLADVDEGDEIPIDRTGPVRIQIFVHPPEKPKRSTSSSVTTSKTLQIYLCSGPEASSSSPLI